MSKQFLTPIRPPVVASFPGSPSTGDTVVLDSDGHLYTFSGAAWIDNGAAGSGGGLTNLDGGSPSNVFGGVAAIDGGTP